MGSNATARRIAQKIPNSIFLRKAVEFSVRVCVVMRTRKTGSLHQGRRTQVLPGRCRSRGFPILNRPVPATFHFSASTIDQLPSAASPTHFDPNGAGLPAQAIL